MVLMGIHTLYLWGHTLVYVCILYVCVLIYVCAHQSPGGTSAGGRAMSVGPAGRLPAARGEGARGQTRQRGLTPPRPDRGAGGAAWQCAGALVQGEPQNTHTHTHTLMHTTTHKGTNTPKAPHFTISRSAKKDQVFRDVCCDAKQWILLRT